jgi:hypothetical protein
LSMYPDVEQCISIQAQRERERERKIGTQRDVSSNEKRTDGVQGHAAKACEELANGRLARAGFAHQQHGLGVREAPPDEPWGVCVCVCVCVCVLELRAGMCLGLSVGIS